MKTTIFIQNKPYYYFDSYKSYEQALKIAKKYKEDIKNKYFILKTENSIIFPTTIFQLYMTKIQ